MSCTQHPRVIGCRFCPTCRQVYDPDELRQVGSNMLPRFIGRASLALEKFWHTGDPNDA